MKRILFDLFRAVDVNDNGFLTVKDFQTILNNMNLDLTPL
jgi:hypothetical protein